MSSSESSPWHCEQGLFTECSWFFQTDLRELLGGGAVLLHVLAAGVAEDRRRARGLWEAPQLQRRLETLIHWVRAVGVPHVERALLHLSKPSAIVHSAGPPSTSCLAMNSALEPVEQLLFALYFGMRAWPSS